MIEDKDELPELPNAWVYSKVENVAEIIMGQSPPGESYNQEGVGIPLINGPVEFGSTSFSRTFYIYRRCDNYKCTSSRQSLLLLVIVPQCGFNTARLRIIVGWVKRQRNPTKPCKRWVSLRYTQPTNFCTFSLTEQYWMWINIHCSSPFFRYNFINLSANVRFLHP